MRRTSVALSLITALTAVSIMAQTFDSAHIPIRFREQHPPMGRPAIRSVEMWANWASEPGEHQRLFQQAVAIHTSSEMSLDAKLAAFAEMTNVFFPRDPEQRGLHPYDIDGEPTEPFAAYIRSAVLLGPPAFEIMRVRGGRIYPPMTNLLLELGDVVTLEGVLPEMTVDAFLDPGGRGIQAWERLSWLSMAVWPNEQREVLRSLLMDLSREEAVRSDPIRLGSVMGALGSHSTHEEDIELLEALDDRRTQLIIESGRHPELQRLSTGQRSGTFQWSSELIRRRVEPVHSRQASQE